MKIYMYVDNPELGEQEQAMADALNAWVGEDNPHASFVYDTTESITLGIEFEMKNKKFLAAPLKDLYALAQQYKCDFVVGFYEGEDREDVCYFGKEEGKPDAFEIGSYLGFSH